MIQPAVLRGYVLEELLAALLQASGYDLLVDEAQDRAALTNKSNGLCIRGRGADHQVDVLGQLRVRVRFTLPVRLFLEAKHHKDPVGLADVRNALGVLNDVNEHFSAGAAARSPHRYDRYQYRYAVFSASGFTSEAQAYAITQQISLVDLSEPAFEWILNAASRVTDALMALAERTGLESFPVRQAREALRRALGTWPGEDNTPPADFQQAAARARRTGGGAQQATTLPVEDLAGIASDAADLENHLYLGYTSSPFLLVLQPDNPEGAEALLEPTGRALSAELRFAGTTPDAGEWTLTTSDSAQPVTFRLGVPPALEPWVLGDDSSAFAPSRAPSRFGRTVAVVVGDQETDLLFAPTDEPEPTLEWSPEQSDYRRRGRLDPNLAHNRPTTDGPRWNRDAAQELLWRLQQEGRPHAEIIQYAAAHGGVITREMVYEIARYPRQRMLKGFTRPPTRITRALVRQGLLPAGIEEPLQTKYASGVVATHWLVPEEFRSLLT